MLITLTARAPHAPELGYLFAKNPASVFAREVSAGRVWVFYPEVTEEQITIALVEEIDPIGLVRGPAALAQLDQYVNDRPYAASSLTSVALQTAFSTALAGNSRDRPDRLAETITWEIMIPAIACEAGAEFITRIFAPLGYAVTANEVLLDREFPQWGASHIFSVKLTGQQTVQDALSHLYVLIPVLDNSKHYFVGPEEAEKLLAHGGAWLAAHPDREIIARRYLRYRHTLVRSALAHLAAGDAPEDAAANVAAADPVAAEDEQPGLHEHRLLAVMDAVRECGATSLADLGCGEGRLLDLAHREPQLTRILGMDVSPVALARARRRLHYDEFSPTEQARLTITQGSLLYRDARLADFDAAALVEVIEHLDPPRLRAFEHVIFAHARPRRIIITTPNREYNARFGDQTRLRHGDHRFEWTRAEGRAWAEHIAATHPYRFIQAELGPVDSDLGAPSQMFIFDRLGTAITAL
jgi:3' terminal RNA ribose 2'-O-methyltransferase Hen1